jgi:glycosyltransferase involved in cell wall biosynthesis
LSQKTADLPNIHLSGWLNAEQIKILLNKAWAGIVPCKSVENAAPNKVFEYLSAGLPLISSLRGEVASLIDEHKIGLNYSAGDPQQLYRCIQTLSNNHAEHDRVSNAAFQFYLENGDANKIYQDFADYIENFVSKHRKDAYK